MKEQVRLMKVVYEFLDCLSEKELELLVVKKAKLRLDINEKQVIVPKSSSLICLDEVCNKIESYTTREEAIEYINSLSLLKVDLKAIAKNYNIPLASKETNMQIVEKIVENIVGSKLKFDALLNTNLKK